MKYLLFGCDPVGGPPLWDQHGGPSDVWPLELPAVLQSALLDWNSRMGAIISRSDLYEADALREMFASLNAEGDALAAQLNEVLKGEAKVRYLREPG